MYPIILALICNVVLFLWISFFHPLIPFSYSDYEKNANHYREDTRVSSDTFYLPNALAQYDSQWYLKIAESGYPYKPALPVKEDTKIMDGLLFNFFPLYPILIAATNVLIHNIEISGFILSNILFFASSFSLYYVVSRWYSKEIAVKTLLLFLVFPFGIFLRGYYAEGIRLLLFIWFCYGLTQRKLLLSGLCVGLMSISSGISFLLIPFYYGILIYYKYKKKISFKNVVLYGSLSIIPLVGWILFCYVQAGDPFYFVKTRALWYRPDIFPLLHNIMLMITFPTLPLRSFYGSQIDVIFILILFCLVYLSRNILPKVVWLATIVLMITPLFIQDTISTTRFSVVLFPFLVFLAALKQKYYYVMLFLFLIGILSISLFYVNWYWIE